VPARLTVVTPCLNAVATLPETLRSVREQDHPDVEHIVVDGASADGTVELLRGAHGIRWISEPDRGLAHAMNKGVAMATGQVIGELNADDRYRPGALRAVAAAFAAPAGVEWVTGRCPIIDADGREIRRPVTAFKNALLRRYSFGLYLTHNFVSAPATFFRTDVLREIGGFDERYRISVDYDLQLKLARRGDPTVLDQDLAEFRMAEGSLSMSGFERQFAEHAEQARRHGGGHRAAVAVNRAMSRLIILAYRGMRAARAGESH
jgi:glycosyltransferase involved in cell wall biosynthesis